MLTRPGISKNIVKREGSGKTNQRSNCQRKDPTYRSRHIRAFHPRRFLRRIRPSVDRSLQLRRKSHQHRRRVRSSRILFHHLRVPCRMQICRLSLPGHGDLVAAQSFSLVVQWLRDVADEVDQELECLLAIGEGATTVIDALGLWTLVRIHSVINISSLCCSRLLHWTDQSFFYIPCLTVASWRGSF